MIRPLCSACNKNFAAINYHVNNTVHYRSRCDTCIRLRKHKKPAVPKWKQAGYKKKAKCDRCGFKFKLVSQALVYHVDSNLNNTDLTNLKTICLNCVEDVKRQESTWRPSSLEPD